MGFKLAAFTEGSSPKMMPMIMENSTDKKIKGMLMDTGAFVSVEISSERPIPAPVSYTHLTLPTKA